ncbi:MAG: cell surface protein SprA [Balneolaceae bacterium]
MIAGISILTGLFRPGTITAQDGEKERNDLIKARQIIPFMYFESSEDTSSPAIRPVVLPVYFLTLPPAIPEKEKVTERGFRMPAMFDEYVISYRKGFELGESAESKRGEGLAPDTLTSEFYRAFPLIFGDRISKAFPKKSPPLYYLSLPVEKTERKRRDDGGFEVVRTIHGYESSLPSGYSFEDYKLESRENDVRENWKRLIAESALARGQQRGLLDFRISVPGGRQSAFTTLFGKPEVNLRVNGVASMNVGASIQTTADPSLPPDQQTRIDPTFDQSLQLNIQGTIGDKLSIQTDWDTERAFDFQNRLNIVYEGYDDEVIKRIELGNVSMQTGNSLIRGSGALFGIKSVVEFGPLRFTNVLSQQDGETNVETISGGSQEQHINIRPVDYEDDKHFFLDFFTRQEFENSMSNPQQLTQTLQIADVELWLLPQTSQAEAGSRKAVALAEMGVNENPDGTFNPPSNNADPFDPEVLNQFRNPQDGISPADIGVSESINFEEGFFELLQEGEDYTINKVSGFISLRRSLGASEVLAVSFTWIDGNGNLIEVGELNQGGGDRIFLKMLRPRNVSTSHKVFPLTMRNIYSLGTSNITRENLDIELLFTEGNLAQNRLPGRTTTLLQDLGLDRVDTQGAINPDNQIDFGTGTLNPVNGTIVFPFLEPFGNRIEQVLESAGVDDETINRVSFRELYSQRKQNAAQISKNEFYRFDGISKGGVQENYTLGIALVPGSVRVFANGVELQEDVDFQVDFSFGSITILNDRFLAPGQDIRIEYENQAFTSIQQKTFTGMRAEYEVNRNINIGATYFRFNERPLDDKIRINEEPINNSIIGLDANARFEAPFITRALDAFPLLQTRERSEISFSGEFAQLRPGVSETRAVSRAIDNNELFSDEEAGVSFIDDFEGSNIKISLLNATRWHLAAAPAAVPGFNPDEGIFEEDDFPGDPVSNLQSRLDRSDLRSKFSWYTIPRNISSILGGVEFTPESLPVRVQDVFPGRETRNPQEEIINTLDIHYDPGKRGPYNYNMDLRNLLENEPERTWGGMTTVVPSGQEDFSQNNIEFLEFWIQPILPGGREPDASDLEAYSGKMFIDIGLVSEDVIPNSQLNSEDGLGLNPETLILDRASNPRSAIPANPPPPEGQFSNRNRELEDVGLDGLPNEGGFGNLNEQTVFSDFVEQMRIQYGEDSEEFQKIAEDPSNDDYIFYAESQVQNLPLHQRFHRLLGFTDGNTPITQGEKRAITNRPDTEGLVNPAVVNQTNAYFQYEIDLNPADISSLESGSPGTFIVDQVPGSSQQNRWFQVRIPLTEFKRRFGDINDFQNISYVRMWMSGYEKPFTVRFATFEFVGSQWRKDESINTQNDPNADIKVSSVNIEENSNRRPFPYRIPEGVIRAQNRGTQLQSLQNEQSIALEVENLSGNSIQMVKRVYPGGLNLLNYSNLRMFVHGEGYDNREDLELVIRMGNDIENNYYEYRQPVTPSDPNFPFQPFDPTNQAQMREEAEQVWLTDVNSVNILLPVFNQLKQLRDQEGPDDISILFERDDILQDAVPGAVVAIKGNPSLGRISQIGLGVRNPYDIENPSGPGVPLLNAQVWLNELRVSGFDNERGWAANFKTSFKLADFATFNGNFSRQTQGFGSLDSQLGQRRVDNRFAYDLSGNMNLHKFIPERYGWNIPLSLSLRRSISTPKYMPNQGDIRLVDFRSAVRSRQDLTAEEQDILIDQTINDVQTFRESFSMNFSNISKQNSQARFLQYTLDNLTLNYVFNTGNGRNPEYRFEDNWNFSTSLRYNLNFRNVRFFRPLSFLEGVPILKTASGLQLGYMPNNVTASISTSRTFEERKRRISENEEEVPLRQIHNFTYNTNFGFGYNFTRSISTSFQARGSFDLGRAAIRDAGLSGADSTAFEPIPTLTVFKDLLFDTLSSRRNDYQEDYTASWQPRFNTIRAISWLNYSARYGGGFRWRNSPVGSDLGATVSNSFRLDHTLRMDIENLFTRIPFYKKIVADDKDATNERNRQASRRQNGSNNVNESDEIGRSIGEEFIFYSRKLLLAMFSMRSIDVSYNTSKTASQAGFAGGSQIRDLFGGDSFSPDFGFRLGLSEEIPRDQLISNIDGTSAIQIPANNTFSDRINVSTKLNPFENFTIDLTWNSQWDERINQSITLETDNSLSEVRAASGSVSSSVWSFGSNFEDFFRRQLRTAFEGMNLETNEIGPANGKTLLNKVSLQEDFRKAYLSGSTGAIGDRGFTPFPLPNWRINWSGIEKLIPFIGESMQRATITHGYSGRYRLGWSFQNNAGQLTERRIGNFTVLDVRSEIEPNSINIEQSFSPLIQLNITWDNNIRTQIGYESSKLTSLALSNSQVTERTSNGLRFQFAYTIRNFRMPLFRRSSNNLDITLSGNLIDDTEQRFLLDADIDRALSQDFDFIPEDLDQFGFNPRPPTGQSRFNGSLSLGYRFSSTVQSNFEYSFTKVNPKSSRTFERTTHDVRFNIRINIRSS